MSSDNLDDRSHAGESEEKLLAEYTVSYTNDEGRDSRKDEEQLTELQAQNMFQPRFPDQTVTKNKESKIKVEQFNKSLASNRCRRLVAKKVNYRVDSFSGDEDSRSRFQSVKFPLGDKWMERYTELQQYKKVHGVTLVRQKFKKNQSLGRWVNNQRTECKNGRLSQERIDALNKIGFVWQPQEDLWWDLYEELLQYKKCHGDTRVPRGYEVNPPLGDFHQSRYDELIEYKKDHGNTLVPQENSSLGKWVNKQRIACRAGKLSKERLDALNTIGFVWDVLEDQWSKQYEELQQYKNDHGDTLVPKRFKENPSLGEWVKIKTQCTAFKNGRLSPERIDALKEIGFVWHAA
eukprot:scaffold12086_cov66-Cyclotella_meneghiniana.AAC.4